MDKPAELNKLRWRSRRGMRELDHLFDRYLSHCWAQASEAERGVFLRFLDCEDDKLWRWLIGYEVCQDASFAALIVTMRALPA